MRASRFVCALVVGLGLLRAGSALAQQGAPQPDFTTAEEKVTKLSGNFYTIVCSGPSFYPSPNGRPVGTTGMLAGPDGVLLVDGQFAPLTDKIVAAIKQTTPGQIKTLINTHVHGDHTGGNENFGKLGVTIMSTEQLKTQLATPG